MQYRDEQGKDRINARKQGHNMISTQQSGTMSVPGQGRNEVEQGSVKYSAQIHFQLWGRM